MKTMGTAKIINVIGAVIFGIATLGCNGNVFKSLTKDSDITLAGTMILVDTIADVRIDSISSTTADGTYGEGASVNVVVRFSKPVTVSGGTIDVTLNTGRTVSVTGSYPSAILSGTYTVSRGDYSHNVANVVANLDATAVALSGGSIIDHLNRNVAVTLPDAPRRIGVLKNIQVDGRVPTIVEVTSSSADSVSNNPATIYKIGDVIDITVNFSRPVTLAGGTLDVTLETGAVDRVVQISPFSNSSVAHGTYTVAAGDDSEDLNSTSLALNGATLRDEVGNNADITIPSEESLADNKDIIVDGITPYVTDVTSESNSGIYGLGTSVNVTVHFNERVTLGGGTLTVTLDTGDVISLSNPSYPSSQLSGTYTVGAGDVSADLNSTALTLSLGASVKDKADYDASLTIPSGHSLADNKNIRVDGDSPTITAITSSDSSGIYGIGASMDITVNFSKPVTLSGGTLDITLETGTSDAVIQISAFTSSDVAHGSYTVLTGHQSPDLDANNIVLNGGTLRDAALNPVLVELPGSRFTSKDMVIDGIVPTVASITSSTSNGTYGVDANINVTVNFTETVNIVGGTLDVQLNTGTTLHLTGSGSSSISGTYTVAAGQSTGDLNTTGISLSGGTLRDTAGNNATISLPVGNNLGNNKDIVIDGILPAVTSAETMDADGNGMIDHYRLTFNRNINDSTFAPAQWSVAGYTVVGLNTSSAAPISDAANDNILYIEITDGGSYDTGAKPDITTTAAPGLRDFRGNYMAQIGTATVVETDKAAPIIVAASGVTGHTGMSIQFSEQVDGNGSLGGCNAGQFSASSFTYTDSGNAGGATGITGMDADLDACDDNRVTVLLNSNLVVGDLNTDRVNPVSNAVKDMADNVASSARLTAVSGAISPYVIGAYGNLHRKIRITYSEPVDDSAASNATSALRHANYVLIEDPTESGCSGSGSDTIAIDTASPIVQISPEVFEITTTAAQCSSTTYRLTVSNVIDKNDGVTIVDPNFATFMGNEQLMVASATCLTTTSMLVVFNKAVVGGTGTGGAELNTRYKFNNAILGTNPSSAVRGSGANTNQVTLGTLSQSGATFMVIGSNAINGDGFDDVGVGAIMTSEESPQESLQPSPKDRGPWVGCGPTIDSFDGGPIAVDPFGDGSTFGFLASYHEKLYIGPNGNGNASNRMEPDGSNPTNCYFTFVKDTSTANGTGTHDNSSVTPPTRYKTIGHTGCTRNSADINAGCGPDNENGRGLFVNGMINGTEYLFITGGRSYGEEDGNNDYLYQTTDTDTTLDFNFIDLSATYDGGDDFAIVGNRGTESINVFSNRVYWMEPGDRAYRPYLVKLNNLNAQSIRNTDSVWMKMRYMTGIGASSGSKPNKADRIGGTLFEFNGKLYLANSGSVRDTTNGDYTVPTGCSATSGSPRCINNGGIVRSNGTNALNPGACSGPDNCPDWTDITPASNTDFTYYFSKIITKLADVIPANRPVPSFAKYKNNLYMIRNACTTNMINTSCNADEPLGSGTCSDDIACPSGNEVWQLWKCVPSTVGGDCNAANWSLVMQRSSSASPAPATDVRERNNVYTTLLVANGDYLYVGFDNSSTGVEVWRTNNSDASGPASYSDFSQIGSDGLGYPSLYKSLWSAISVNQGGNYYIYLSAGNGVQPVAIFRQRNN
jgi:hypothetical protein